MMVCSGISLFNTDQNDNISLRDLSSLVGWSESTLNWKVKAAKVKSLPARRILMRQRL